MTRSLRAVLVLLLVAAFSQSGSAVQPGIAMIGKGLIGGNVAFPIDKSGLTGQICQAGVPANCVPQSIFGGFGSALTYTGHDDVFIATPDRGPFDGLTDVPFLDRVDFLHITVDPSKPFPNITTTLLDTRLLKDEFDQAFVGAADAFDVNNPAKNRRLDPEGIRVSNSGTFYLSDEYGPYLLEFDRQGHLIRRIEVPDTFAIAKPDSNPNNELLNNTSGRQANRGMEGLAISPDGTTLFGLMQNALLQDEALTPNTTTRKSVVTRILKIDLPTGQTEEYAYVLDTAGGGQGVNEMLAINNHEFLVIERDGQSFSTPGSTGPKLKTIYRIDVTGASDVTGRHLPATGVPASVKPVTKSLFIDLLDPAFKLNMNDANQIAEKIEGLAWGPDLPDGRHVLYVVSDNDLIAGRATQIYAFAIDDRLLAKPLNYIPQVLPGPLFPPGQVKKLVGR